MRQRSILVFSLIFVLTNIGSAFALEKIKLTIVDGKTQKLLVEYRVEVAMTYQEQTRGLSQRTNLPENEGMLFVFPANSTIAFWMKDTYLALDLIFIDGQGKIVDIATHAKPLSETAIKAKQPYRYCLEINAGQAKLKKIKEGDQVVFR